MTDNNQGDAESLREAEVVRRILSAGMIALDDAAKFEELRHRLREISDLHRLGVLDAGSKLVPSKEAKRLRSSAAHLERFLVRVFGDEGLEAVQEQGGEVRHRMVPLDAILKRFRDANGDGPFLRSDQGTMSAALLGQQLAREQGRDDVDLEHVEEVLERVAWLYGLTWRTARAVEATTAAAPARHEGDGARQALVFEFADLYEELSRKTCGVAREGPGPSFIAAAFQGIAKQGLSPDALVRDLRAWRSERTAFQRVQARA